MFERVIGDIKTGRSFPTLERAYQRAVGNSEGRQILLHLLAEQPEDQTIFDEDVGRVVLNRVRKDAEDLDVQHIQISYYLELVDVNFGPVLTKLPEKPGIYEFVNPVFRLYVRLRQF